MAVYSEFEVDGEVRDLYDKAAIHEEDLDDAIDEIIDPAVVALYTELGADFE